MSVPTLVAKSEDEISIQWGTLSGSTAGDSTVTTYDLYWDNNSGTPNIQLINSLITSYTVSGLTGAGASYKFKVRAHNVYGSGAFSTILTVLASDVPD